ncbi:MAG TPA: c-type cytochrome domain-containing protein [Pirellulaceae bacterium]|jgi:hypothetical protein|nr:c-type cytochrome domain-containing protein [Pirellulaceae bacterium]
MNALRATLALALLTLSAVGLRAQDMPPLSPEVAKIHVELREASREFSAKDFDGAAARIAGVQETLDALLESPPAGAAEQLEPIYVVLERAHGLMKAEGQQLPPLKKPNLALLSRMSESIPDPSSVPIPAPTPTPDPTPPKPTGTVSFVNDVAPILTQRCGGCHVAKASGRLSIKDYETLMKGHPVNGIIVAPGNPPGSVLLEMIEAGQMPPNGNGIPAQEYQTLTTWVAEGAQFDGTDPKANLARLAKGDSTPTPEAPPMNMTPTGNESVSFARHIAPLLVENCNGCHFRPNQVRGGLNFTMFAGLMEGGDSGSPIMPGQPEQSLLVGKLKGTADGAQMPMGRAEFSEEQIALFEKWIAEGAKFDGPDPAAPLDQVAALAMAEASTPEELTEIRREKSDEKWRLGMGTVAPDKVETEQFLFYGNVGENTLKELADAAEAVSADVRQALGTPASAPLAKGKITLFVTAQRYDFGEFGSMVDRRKMAGDRFGYPRYTIVDAYGVVLPSRDGGFSNEALLAEQIAAIHAAAQGKDVPEWFYSGAGQMVAAALYEDDPRIVAWNDQLVDAVRQMNSPDDFLTGKVPPEAASLASWSFVDYLSRDKRKFGTLMDALREGQGFAPSFIRAYGGPPQQLAYVWAQNALRRR